MLWARVKPERDYDAPSPTKLSPCGAFPKSYDGRRVVGPLDFALAAGSVTGLLGGNGAGKTTTIGMIMGLIEPTTGAISALGARWRRTGRACWAA